MPEVHHPEADENHQNPLYTKESNTDTEEKDIFRDTPLRYLGYANEVGEAFRAHVPVSVVRFSYLVASGYVCADAYCKGQVASKFPWSGDGVRRTKVAQAVLDTLMWQGLASVAIPGFTINRICYGSNKLLQKSTNLPGPTRIWAMTVIGLWSIPFIIKPIDRFVDWLMESTVRKWYGIGPVLEESIVHHERNE